MTWNHIRQFLRQEVLQQMRDARIAENWLDDLPATREGERLAICMAIDIKSGSVSRDQYANLLSLLDPRKSNPRSAFSEAARTYKERNPRTPFSRFSRAKSQTRYARVLKLEDFIKYYAPPHYSLSDLEEVREVFFLRNRLDVVANRRLSGGYSRVWVLPLSELLELLDSVDEEQAPSLINDVLGLGKRIGSGKENLPEFVFLKYPEAFTGAECSQPTAADRDWSPRESYYVSYWRHDAWGRTHCCSGERRRLRERVHGPVETPGPGFSGGYIGLVNSLSFNRPAVLAEAYQRFLAT